MTRYDDYLAHYGVIGMRWGAHRAARRATSDLRKQMKSGAVSKEQYKKAYADAKNKATGKHVWHDRGASQRMNQMSRGKRIAQALTLGNYGAYKYNQMMAKGSTSKGKAIVKSILLNEANLFTAGAVGGIDAIKTRKRNLRGK